MNNRAYSTLSLCKKAGRMVSGEFLVEKAIKTEEVLLVIVATDASDNTKKKFKNMCDYRQIDYVEFGDKESLGRAIGKEIRASIGIMDSGFSNSMKKHLENYI